MSILSKGCAAECSAPFGSAPSGSDCPHKIAVFYMIHTAISRAKKQVILVGSEESLHAAMTTPADPRKSKLVTKVHQKLHFAA